MKLGKEEVEKVAELARLDLIEFEKDIFGGQLNTILDYFDKLKEIEISEVEPTSHVSVQRNVFREDQAVSAFSKNDLLQNSPDSKKGCFRVPKIIE